MKASLVCNAMGFSDRYRCNVSQCFLVVFSNTSGSTPCSSMVYSVVACVRSDGLRMVPPGGRRDGGRVENAEDRRHRKLAERRNMMKPILSDDIDIPFNLNGMEVLVSVEILTVNVNYTMICDEFVLVVKSHHPSSITHHSHRKLHENARMTSTYFLIS